MTPTSRKLGQHIKVGDTLYVGGRSHRITRLQTYDGPHLHNGGYPHGARLAHVEGHVGSYMAIPNTDYITVAA